MRKKILEAVNNLEGNFILCMNDSCFADSITKQEFLAVVNDATEAQLESFEKSNYTLFKNDRCEIVFMEVKKGKVINFSETMKKINSHYKAQSFTYGINDEQVIDFAWRNSLNIYYVKKNQTERLDGADEVLEILENLPYIARKCFLTYGHFFFDKGYVTINKTEIQIEKDKKKFLPTVKKVETKKLKFKDNRLYGGCVNFALKLKKNNPSCRLLAACLIGSKGQILDILHAFCVDENGWRLDARGKFKNRKAFYDRFAVLKDFEKNQDLIKILDYTNNPIDLYDLDLKLNGEMETFCLFSRHGLEFPSIFGEEIKDPFDFTFYKREIYNNLIGLRKVIIYVTGLTVALVEVINFCNRYDIELILMHYDKSTNSYVPQKVGGDYK